MENDGFHELSADSIDKKPVDFSIYRDKVVLVVNTASRCGFTPQYEGLENVYKKYKDQGLVILGFPCNQFGKQEPEDEEAIKAGCLRNYGVSFPMFAKVKVNGKNASPVFRWLTERLRGALGARRIEWNFTKFLIDRNGEPVKRFAPTVKPKDIEDDIRQLLKP